MGNTVHMLQSSSINYLQLWNTVEELEAVECDLDFEAYGI